MAYGQGDCHKCGSRNLSFGKSQIKDESLGYEFICDTCGASGVEWYKLEYDDTTMNDQKGIVMANEFDLLDEALVESKRKLVREIKSKLKEPQQIKFIRLFGKVNDIKEKNLRSAYLLCKRTLDKNLQEEEKASEL